MTEILRSPPQLPSASSSITFTNNDGLHQHTFLNHEPLISRGPVASYRRNRTSTQLQDLGLETEEGEDQVSVLEVLVTVLRKSLVGCKSIDGSGVEEPQLMEIGWPTNVRHVAHVTFDRFNGFLGLPVEFEPEVPRRPPSASTRVFGVSTESMQLSFDSRGNCVPTILLMMQRRLYLQGGLQSEGIFRINPENGQEEYVREQLNNGLIPDNIDVHCLAGLIKAWFRELPRGILDSLSPDQVMQAQSEDECTHLVRQLPPTEAALLDWAINLMADVAQFEHMNKMNARNIAMVFAPNMTQMSDPLTALMYAVQVMNFLKTLIVRTLKEREESVLESGPAIRPEPSNEDGQHTVLKPANEEEEVDASNVSMPNQSIASTSHAESRTDNKLHGFLNSIENILTREEKGLADDNSLSQTSKDEGGKTTIGGGRTQTRSRRTKSGHDSNNFKKESRKHINEGTEKSKEIRIIGRVNSHRERVEAWR